MNNQIADLIFTYNTFIDDLQSIVNEISSFLQTKHSFTPKSEWWSPRDRSAWSKKNRFCKIHYKNKDEIFYTCFDLGSNTPYLQIYYIKLNIEKTKVEDFDEYTSFVYIDNPDEKKVIKWEHIHYFEKDWGQNYYCKVDLETIKNSEILNTEITAIYENLMNTNLNLLTNLRNVSFLD